MNKTNCSDLDFGNYIQELEKKLQDSNYREGVSFALPENPTPVESLKYNLCEKLIVYKRERNLTLEEFCNRAKISEELAGEILYYHLDYFNLEQIVEAASNIFSLSIGAVQNTNKVFLAHNQH